MKNLYVPYIKIYIQCCSNTQHKLLYTIFYKVLKIKTFAIYFYLTPMLFQLHFNYICSLLLEQLIDHKLLCSYVVKVLLCNTSGICEASCLMALIKILAITTHK